MVTALSIAGELDFNPQTDSLTGTDGKNRLNMLQILFKFICRMFRSPFFLVKFKVEIMVYCF